MMCKTILVKFELLKGSVCKFVCEFVHLRVQPVCVEILTKMKNILTKIHGLEFHLKYTSPCVSRG